MGQNKEERRVKIRRVFLIEVDLTLERISGGLKGIDFIEPEGFLVEGITAQGKSQEETEEKADHISSADLPGLIGPALHQATSFLSDTDRHKMNLLLTY